MIGQAHMDTVTDLFVTALVLSIRLRLIEIETDCVSAVPKRSGDAARLAAALGLKETVAGRLWSGVLHGDVQLELWAAS